MDRRKIAEEIERLAADLKSARIDADDLLAGLAAVSEVVTNSTRASAAAGEVDGDQVVTPWAVAAKPGQIIDYEKLINEFGCQRIDRNLIDRISRLTNQPAHALLRRGVFFAHRELDQLLDAYKNGDKFYVYTGRGPSSGSLHLGHLIPFMFTRYLQEAFKVPVVIQLTDDEKFLCRPELSVEQCMRFARENVKDIIACGFDISKTFIFSNFKKSTFGDGFFLTQTLIQKHVSNGKASSIFGFTSKDNIGKNAFPASQAAPSFSATFPHIFSGEKNLRCLIPCAVDQDPYFRMTRAVAPKLEFKKPSLIESKFLGKVSIRTGPN